MNLVIAEKKLVADAIAKAVGVNPKQSRGFIQCDNYVITWCVGHLLELAEPHEYNPELKDWLIETLPFFIRDVKKNPIDRTKDQFKVVKELVKKANVIYHAGDPDDEGQLIVDEVLDYFNFNKPVKRVLINDNNPVLVAKAFQQAEDNSIYRHLGYMALGRSCADWHFGLNLTRAYTVLEQRKGLSDLITVGRVQDVIKGLVVRRCRDIANFKPKDYFVITADLSTVNGEELTGRYANNMNQLLIPNLDEENRIVVKADAENVVANIQQHNHFKVLDITVEEKSKAPPLPYNLLKLQIDMSRKFGKSMDETLEITQTLRDNYNAITYNRSDCQYLNDEMYDDAPEILKVIGENANIFQKVIAGANPNIKSKCFNSKKTSAHHAIIPTFDNFDITKLTDDERNCYFLVARAFIAQFYPVCKYNVQTITIGNGQNDNFIITSRVITDAGWSKLYKNDKDNEETKEEAEYVELSVALKTGDIINVDSPRYDTKQTKPPKYYTEDTLAAELTKVAKYIKDENLRRIMLEKDKDKAGEHGGIGTPATRGEIMKNLKEKGFFIVEKKKIMATDKCYQLYDKLPDVIKYPDLTALWHDDMKNIKTLEDSKAFVQKVMRPVAQIVSTLKGEYDSVETYTCPECGKELNRYKGKTGMFWSCIGFKDKSCKYNCTDLNNKPTFEKPVFNANTGAKKKSGFKKKF